MQRRSFLTLTASTLGLNLLPPCSRDLIRPASAASNSSFEIASVDRTTVKLEYRDVPRRNMDRELPHWRYIEICDVTLKSGHR